jgi:hypothetical protein
MEKPLLKPKGLLDFQIEKVLGMKTDINDPYAYIIGAWIAQSPQNKCEYDQLVEQNKISRIKSRIHGASQQETVREGMSIPVGLYRALEKFDPELFTNEKGAKKKRDRFRRLHPEFTTFKD